MIIHLIMSQNNPDQLQDDSEVAKGHYNWRALCSIPHGEDYLECTAYSVDDRQYYLTGSGEVYEDASEDGDKMAPVTAPSIVQAVLEQSEQDRNIAAAREKVALTLSANNPLLAEVLRMHLEYNGGSVNPEPYEEEGIKFYSVGHNASHYFFLGVKDGKMYKRVLGEEGWDKETDEPIFKSHIYEVNPNQIGYIGHF